jgi:hypothetical protein
MVYFRRFQTKNLLTFKKNNQDISQKQKYKLTQFILF